MPIETCACADCMAKTASRAITEIFSFFIIYMFLIPVAKRCPAPVASLDLLRQTKSW